MKKLVTISSHDLTEGQQVAGDYYDHDNQLIIVFGERLDAQKLERFRAEPSQMVTIFSWNGELLVGNKKLLGMVLRHHIDKLFRYSDNNTDMQGLKSLLQEYRLGGVEKGG